MNKTRLQPGEHRVSTGSEIPNSLLTMIDCVADNRSQFIGEAVLWLRDMVDANLLDVDIKTTKRNSRDRPRSTHICHTMDPVAYHWAGSIGHPRGKVIVLSLSWWFKLHPIP
jgi:hypothetical protein